MSNSKMKKSQINRKLFDLKQHQNLLINERQLQIKQFQTIMAYKNVQTIPYEDGSVFKGQINQEGQRHGYGMLSGADGSVYMGKWKSDLYHQQGIYLYPDGQRYEGEIIEGLKEGIGKMFYLNGDIYEGQWMEDNREGHGEISYGNGDRYIGQWKGNQRYGEGAFYNGVKLIAEGTWDNTTFLHGKVTTEQYQGEWAFNGPHGQGLYNFQDGSAYSGEWKNGQKDGYGRYQFQNGDFYQGQFRCGLKHGKGFYKYASGDSYEGQFYNDYKQGYGIMKFINGDEYRGNWDKDLFNGPGNYIFSSKQGLNGPFHYGMPMNEQQQANKAITKAVPKQIDNRLIDSKYVYSPVRVDKNYGILNSQSRLLEQRVESSPYMMNKSNISNKSASMRSNK